MKFNYIVAALGLAASASSFAAILPADTAGGGELFLVVYEQGAPNGGLDQSFTLDLGITTSQFIASKNTAQTWATLDSSNRDWVGFLNTSDIPSLQFSVMGAQITSTSVTQNGASSIFSTVTLGREGDVVGATAPQQNSNSQLSSMIAGTLNGYTQTVTGTGTHVTQDNGWSVNVIGSSSFGAYFQERDMQEFNRTLKFSNNNAVGSAPVEFTSLYRSPVGTGKALQYVEPLMVSFVQSGGQYVLNYGATATAAVPEASGFAMALAGFGLLGFVANRRKQK